MPARGRPGLGPRPHCGDTSGLAGCPVTEVLRRWAEGPQPLHQSQLWPGEGLVPASEMQGALPVADSSGHSAECRGGRKHVAIWDPKPGASRNAVVRQRWLRLSKGVAEDAPTTGQGDEGRPEAVPTDCPTHLEAEAARSNAGNRGPRASKRSPSLVSLAGVVVSQQTVTCCPTRPQGLGRGRVLAGPQGWQPKLWGRMSTSRRVAPHCTSPPRLLEKGGK